MIRILFKKQLKDNHLHGFHYLFHFSFFEWFGNKRFSWSSILSQRKEERSASIKFKHKHQLLKMIWLSIQVCESRIVWSSRYMSKVHHHHHHTKKRQVEIWETITKNSFLICCSDQYSLLIGSTPPQLLNRGSV